MHATPPLPRISTGLTLGDMAERNARLHGEAIAFDDGERRQTHGEFFSRVLRLGSALEQNGVRHQERVAILSMNRLEFFEVYGACELAGFIAATLNYRLAPPELVHMLRDSAPAVLVFEEQFSELVAQLRAALPSLQTFICIGNAPAWAQEYEAMLGSGHEQGPSTRSAEDDIAHLIYTSGTTGRPKGCMLGHRESACKAQMHAADMGMAPDDRVLIVMPLFHVGAKGIQTGAHWRAASVHLQRSFEPADVLKAIESQRITALHLAPTMVHMLLEHPQVSRFDLSSVKVLHYSAAPMPINTLRRGLEVFGNNVFHQVYGQTEGAVSVLLRCQHRPDGNELDRQRLGSVGQPAIGVQVRIAGDDGRDCPEGSEGEIVYRGPTMFRGYWNDTTATMQTLRNGWIHSGDIGRFDSGGFLYIVDRKKDMIISGGENIYSREVEQALAEHPAVSEAAVIGVPDPVWGEAVRALVVRRQGACVSQEELIAFCRTRIASYKKPKTVVFVDALPKLNSGKINKTELRILYGQAAPNSPVNHH